MQKIGVGNFHNLLFRHYPELRRLLATAVNLAGIVHSKLRRGSFETALMLERPALNILAKPLVDAHTPLLLVLCQHSGWFREYSSPHPFTFFIRQISKAEPLLRGGAMSGDNGKQLFPVRLRVLPQTCNLIEAQFGV